MTEEERKKKLAEFRKDAEKAEAEKDEDPWTEDDIRAAANRIAERLGLNVRW